MQVTKINRAQTINKVKKAIHDTKFNYGHVYYSKGIKKRNQLTITASAKAKTVKQAVKIFKESAYQHTNGIY